MSVLRAAVGIVVCACALQGCELVADFDRSKIPGPDASMEAGTMGGLDAGNDEDAGSLPDAGTDAALDAGQDAGRDAGKDAGQDAGSGEDAGAEDGG